MLETEPQNGQSESSESSNSAGQAQATGQAQTTGQAQPAGQEGSHRRGLLRRGRRVLSKPAEPPAFKSGEPESAGGGPAAQAGRSRSGAGRGARSSRGQGGPAGAVPAVPGVPAAGSEASSPGRGARQAPGAPQPVPAAAFQPPVLVFQPPEMGAPAESGKSRGDVGESEGEGGGSRRRRRGGRGRGKGGAGDGGEAADAQAQDTGQAGPAQSGAERGGQGGEADSGRPAERDAASGRPGAGAGAREDSGQPAGESAEGEGGGSSSRRRRRRRQRNGAASGGAVAAGGEVPASDEPADTVVHIREPRVAAEPDDVRAVKGSTRLEAKRQRRREGRDTGRRRPPIISESEFLARREAVERVMVVRQQGDKTQIAVLEDGVLVEHYVDRATHQSLVGNVYLGKVQNVLPSMEAAFVDIGKGRNAVLYAGEVNFDASGLEGVAKRIESALKSGQSIMVQVTKDPIGHKGARLTSQISLPGRYLVYVPGASMTGISRKLPDTERNRLKQILKKVAPEEGGIIVRTAAEGASEEELQHDVTRLVAQWQAIERKAKTATAPDLLYGEPDLTIRVVRDIFNEDFTKLVIASDSEWDLVDEYVRYVAPSLADRMERWTDDQDLFAAYRIDEQLAKALDRKVWLPSGGSLVIDTTEAMTVIDVNTGKFTGQGGNLEQTVTRNNLEAAEEIVRQLRLRDVGGIIVIDFIDMVLESNRDLVLRRLIECLARDRTKHQVAEVTSLGLVQMTRKRVGSGLLAAFSVPCEHCNGRGLIISTELTDVPHSHGRNGYQAGAPKPGPARTRSARSKAIAQVAAKTIESAASSDGAAEAVVGTVAVEPVEPVEPFELVEPLEGVEPVERVEPEGRVEPAGPSVAGAAEASAELAAGAGTGGAAAGTGDAASASREPNGAADSGTSSSISAVPAQGDAEAGEREARATQTSKGSRPRRSARREAGPPDSVLAARSAAAAADGLADSAGQEPPAGELGRGDGVLAAAQGANGEPNAGNADRREETAAEETAGGETAGEETASEETAAKAGAGQDAAAEAGTGEDAAADRPSSASTTRSSGSSAGE
jgi:ribonuclease E